MKQFQKLSYPYLVWAILLIALPMLLIVFFAFTVPGNETVPVHFSLRNFIYFFQDKVFITVLLKSLWISIVTTVFCLVLGYPAAYVISKLEGKQKTLLILLVTFPMWFNMLVRTYAWFGLLQQNGLFSKILSIFGFKDANLLYTDFAVILGMVYNFIPFMILQINSSLEKMDKSLLEAASDLGANKYESFKKVTFPLSLPGIISGITLVFLPTMSSFFIPRLLGGGQYVLIGNLIESQFLTAGNWNFGSAISLVMTIVILCFMLLTKKADKGGNNEA